ncbi:MAG TPA: nuclear transport factor 2 family protein [Bacteroidales bacterium]|nr:nuclear transport factor 2 family protein [Bacteroidales bacterium]
MKNFILLVFICLINLQAFSQNIIQKSIPEYKPDDQKLYDTIVYLDSIFFNAYNTCDIDLQADFYDDNIEFYHDRGGLSTSKSDILESIKNNICGKVTRTRVKASLEVYPIANFGAVEIGYHYFHNKAEGTTSQPSKFITIWKLSQGKWKLSRVISLH